MKDTLLALIRDATRLTRAGQLKEATAAIQNALRGRAAPPQRPPEHPPAPQAPAAPSNGHADEPVVLDGCVFEADAADTVAPAAPVTLRTDTPAVDAPADDLPKAPRPARPDGDVEPGAHPGTFTNGTHSLGSQMRAYKLYAPAGAAGRRLPLVVMLHGCTQDPDDFAAGTAMNRCAAEQGFFVLYPAQSSEANAHRCWNWFKHTHQQRDRGEPALIAGMTQQAIAQHGIDADRVYIAGLSAGGAMAAIVAAAYPDIFAAVGIHSGLPAGAASNLPEALMAMNGGTLNTAWLHPGLAAPAPMTLPAIVFHGDEDKTVHPRNGEQVILRMLKNAPAEPAVAAAPPASVEQGLSPGGRRYTRSTYPGAEDEVLAEHWLVHGAGHAWSGGDAAGSFTDAAGPDATREMLRFFFEHPRRDVR